MVQLSGALQEQVKGGSLQHVDRVFGLADVNKGGESESQGPWDLLIYAVPDAHLIFLDELVALCRKVCAHYEYNWVILSSHSMCR